ncbi:MAG: hypothetical protein DBX55_04645 [Verrucomicrobia bacterium]|nr:MAG: hypothetical protein DBX55_04645 [Verrucomicrobiota bacterium]
MLALSAAFALFGCAGGSGGVGEGGGGCEKNAHGALAPCGADGFGASAAQSPVGSAAEGRGKGARLADNFRGYKLSVSRLRFLGRNFGNALEKNGARAGGMCVVQNGKTLYMSVWDFPENADKPAPDKAAGLSAASGRLPDFGVNSPVPLGKSGVALISLSTLSGGKIRFDEPVEKYCSFFKFGGGKGGSVTAAHLLSMTSGLSSDADALVPRSLSDGGIFEIAAQISPSAAPGLLAEDSALGVQLACEAAAYAENPASKNLRKSFVASMRKNLFSPLGIDSVRLCDSGNPLFLMRGFCLSLADISKWLECETSPSPKISDALSVAARRNPVSERGSRALGWLVSERAGVRYAVCGDDYLGCANVAAVFGDYSCAVAFFAVGKRDAKGAALCACALEDFVSMLTDSEN